MISLVSIITTAASSIESFYKNRFTKPVPTPDHINSYPLDISICPLEVKCSVQILKGTCAQLCTTLSHPNLIMFSVCDYLNGKFLSLESHVAVFEGTTNFNSSLWK